MLFKELKQGYPLYILDCNKIEVGTGTVTYVGAPHITQDKAKMPKGSYKVSLTLLQTSVAGHRA